MGNGDEEEISPASVRGDPTGKFFFARMGIDSYSSKENLSLSSLIRWVVSGGPDWP